MTLFCIMHMKAAKRRQIRKTAKEVPCILRRPNICLINATKCDFRAFDSPSQDSIILFERWRTWNYLEIY